MQVFERARTKGQSAQQIQDQMDGRVVALDDGADGRGRGKGGGKGSRARSGGVAPLLHRRGGGEPERAEKKDESSANKRPRINALTHAGVGAVT